MLFDALRATLKINNSNTNMLPYVPIFVQIQTRASSFASLTAKLKNILQVYHIVGYDRDSPNVP